MGQKVYGFRVLLFLLLQKKEQGLLLQKRRRRPSSLQATKTPASKLRSLLRCRSKQASELAVLQHQASPGASGACCVEASKLWSFWSLLRCSSKQALEPEKLRNLLCCSSKQAPEKFQSLLRCLPLQTKQTQKKKRKKSKHLT